MENTDFIVLLSVLVPPCPSLTVGWAMGKSMQVLDRLPVAYVQV